MKTKNACNQRDILLLLLFVFLETFSSDVLHAAIVPDDYEPDNNVEHAQVIVLNYHTSQKHTFHEIDDEDWVQFYALKGETYKIKVFNSQVLICDPVIELFGSDGRTRLEIVNNKGPGEEEYLLWTCSEETCGGIYYIRVTNAVDHWGANVWYELSVDIPGAFSLPGYVIGTVLSGGNGLSGAVLKAGSGSGLSRSNGSYILCLESGVQSVSVSKSGYIPASFSVTVSGGGSIRRNIELIPTNNSPPTISGITDITVRVGHSFRLVPITSDPDGDNIIFSVVGQPAWMRFDSTTGTLSGTSSEEHLGLHGPITITASDNHGASRSLTPFTVRVVESLQFLPATFHLLFK
jgi:hypothetical protein